MGFHKTGTSWFQRQFYPSVENLDYMHHYQVKKIFLDPRGLEETGSDEKDIAMSGKILCHEELSGNIQAGGLNSFATMEIARRIKDKVENPKIVLFIRNQKCMIASAYSQYIKNGGNYSATRYLFHKEFQKTHREALFSFQHFDYDLKLKYYESLFGKENIHLYLYEDFSADGEGFIKQYKKDLNIVCSVMPKARVNVAYGRGILQLSRLINVFSREAMIYKYYLLHIPGLHSLARRVLPKLNKIKLFNKKATPEALLGDDNIKFIDEYYKASNRRLSERYPLAFEKHGYIKP